MTLQASLQRFGTLAPAAGLYSSYVPLDKIAGQIRRAVLEGDVHRLERLWSSLQERYPSGSLEQCLTHPELHTKETNLTLATKEKLAPVVGWLLDQGFEEDGMTKTDSGDTVLHIAARVDSAEIIAMYHARLSEVYDDEDSDSWLVDWTNVKGESPLCVACQKNSQESVVALLQLGASVHLHGNEGNTPLHHASAYGNIEVIQILLQWQANAFAKNNMGYTASDYAYSFEVEQAIQDAVRLALAAEKRARKLKGQPAAFRSPSALADYSYESEEGTAIGLDATRVAPPSPLPGSLPPLRMPMAYVPPPTPGPASSLASTVPQTPTQKALSCAQTSPYSDHSRAVQRIYARDLNAQQGFQTSAAYKGLVGASSSSSVSSSAITATSLRRERSTSTEMTSASSSSSIVSPIESPASRTAGLPRADFPLPRPPESPLPPLPTLDQKKSSTSAFVSRLKRSGSHGTPTPQSDLEPTLLLHKTVTPGSRRSGKGSALKQHASLADLRSSVRDAQQAEMPSQAMPTDSVPPYTPALHRGGFHFGILPRTRSGT